ncbi:protein argonaute 5 isoform X2 [Trifolium pratense]|uniref:protein argonaute 5 isoform X2 n=1 Tax=Trifolium pratense TaxID=57577 RepID=UPI001E696101|nr:protein argonaute 5 isoform X2 [Trifolium pratense]
MSRRGGGNPSDNRRNQPQPSPATSRLNAAGTGRGGGGRGSRGGHTVPSSSSVHVPPPAPINTAASSVVAPVVHPVHPSVSAPVTGSSSAPTVPSPAPATVSAEALSTEVQQKLTLQSASAPASQKAIRFPNRPGYGQLGKKVQVRANHFQMQVAERDLHHYDVSIAPEIPSKKVSRDIINQLVKMHRESLLENRIPAYDGRKSLFTAGPLPFTSKVFVVNLVDEDRGSSSGSDRKKREREFKVTIRFASKPDIVHLNQFLRRLQPDCPYETIQVLDVALRATPAEMYTVAGRSFFSPNLGAPGPLGGGTEFWRGFYQSLRPTQMGLSLNIDVSSRAFYEPVLVTEFVSKNFKLNFSRQLSDQDRLKIRRALKGLKVRLSHGAGMRSCKVTGLSKEPLKDLTFTLEDKVTKKKVLDYFHEKYNIELKFPLLPAIQSGSDARPMYFPMELCRIESGQRYSKRLNEEQVTNLLRATCQRPHQREQDIKNIVKQHRFNSDKVVKEFGINVREDLALVDARVLTPPTLKYHGTGGESKLDPRMGQWNMISKKMVDGGKVQFWGCLCFAKMDPTMFCQELVTMCQAKGLVFNRDPVVPLSPGNPNQIERELENFNKKCKAILESKQQRLQLLIIIMPDFKGVRTYDKIKRVCETELGIVSQCCQPRQAQKLNKQYLENLALKINVKVGGRNTVLNDAFERRIPLVTDRPTIIFGADVTHPQPGEDSSPSIAAVVASMDWPWVTKYRGVYSAQSHREEIIQDLYKTVVHPQRGVVPSGMIRELIVSFYKATGRKPERIIFYRDGVSEGQFSQVLLYEVDAIRKACASIENGYLPPITFVVVQKRHHTRLFPVRREETDKSGNIMPGTVVDTNICHPREFDFYLNSHAGIQGTSRPAHYHVLFDENRFSADHLQSLTNNLCYTYARCTRSVSIVPPAYYAHLLAFRTRYYLSDAADTSDSDSANGGTRNATNVVAALPSIIESVKDNMFYV